MITATSPPRDVVIPARGGVALKAWHWTRPDPRAVLVIAHGFGEHGGCYRHVAESLVPALRIDVLAPDLRGHGRSPGRRGVVSDYDDLTADLQSALDWSARARPSLPRYVLGHSNGGQVALRVALTAGRELAGLILSNPSLRLATHVPHYKLRLGRFLLRHAPRVTLRAAIAAERLTRDPDMQREHRTDPLRHSRMSAPLFFGMVEGGPRIVERAGEIHQPILILLGSSDPVVDPEATRGLYERLGSADKTLLIYPKMLHEPLNELGREQVLADMTAWLGARLESRA